MSKFYLCVVVLAHYDSLDKSNRVMLDATPSAFFVWADNEADAVADVKSKFLYNQQYFEYHSCSVIELSSPEFGSVHSFFIKKYSSLQPGEKYRIISEDVFVKGKESWQESNNNWLVVTEIENVKQ